MELKRGPPKVETPKRGPEKQSNKDKMSRAQEPDKERPYEGASQYKSETAKVPVPLTPEPASTKPNRSPTNPKTPKRGPEIQTNKNNVQNKSETTKVPDPLTPERALKESKRGLPKAEMRTRGP